MLCLLKNPVLCHGISLSISCLTVLACSSLQLRFADDDYMVQSDYDTVSEVVRESTLKERALIGTPYQPGGSAIIDFIKKLTPTARKYVQDNAPEGRWIDVTQVYKKSLQYELNQCAAVTVHTDSDCDPDAGLDTTSESEHGDDDLLQHDIEHGGWKCVRIPPSVWDARKKSQTCYRCGKPGLRAKDCSAENRLTGLC